MSNYLTARLPGTGGTIKETPDDFVVEEIPLYAPSGEGEHLYVVVEKRGLTTFDLLHRFSKALGIREREMGYAGLKDARATTRQTLSIPGARPEQVRAIEIEGVKILATAYHRNKLRPGHLAGNRFTIRIRQPQAAEPCEKALDILHVLSQLGVPNRFGEQRYGALGNSHQVGRALLRHQYDQAARLVIGDPRTITNERWRAAAAAFAEGDLEGAMAALPGRFRDERKMIAALISGKSPKEAVLGLPRKLLRLYLSACQSELFDRMVAMRLDTIDTVWNGDLAYKHDNGACFVVESPEAEQERVERFEISPSGPMFGYKLTMARGQAGLLEQALLDKEKLKLEDFRLGGGLSMEGERRPLRVPLGGATARLEEADLVLSFSLPKGSYATSVLREIIKDPDSVA